jgi:uncharacterized Zn finger protein
MAYGYDRWPAYVPVAARRAKAGKELAKLRKKGRSIDPVVIEGRAIAKTFWGKAWCDNLESYHDYDNRLPRGRTYVRNGSVMDLQIAPLTVTAIVSGSELYNVEIDIDAAPKAHWQAICRDCAGGIDSLVELLQGRFSKAVMERICRQGAGLFPEPKRIRFSCDCPDYADMCKHVAAVLYGVGARLDHKPELLFQLRGVDERDLLANLDPSMGLSKTGAAPEKILQADDVSALFGLDMAPDEPLASVEKPARTKKPARIAAAPAAPAPQSAKTGAAKTGAAKTGAAKTRTTKAAGSPRRPKAPKPPLQLTRDGYVKWWK